MPEYQEINQFSIHRPSPSPSVNIPFGVRSCGHYKVNGTFKDLVMHKPFLEIFWCINGQGRIVINNEECVLCEKQLAVYYPNAKHQLYAAGEPWEYLWATFDGGLAESTIRSFGFVKEGIYNAEFPSIKIFKQLIKDLKDVSPQGEYTACCTAFNILANSSQQIKTKSNNAGHSQTVKEALSFIHQQWNNPGIGVKQISEHLNVHRSSLTRLFLSEIKITPKEYITRLRVQFALSRLKQAHGSIKKIAEESGWEDPNYFSRCIKYATGQSPSQYRRQNCPELCSSKLSE